MQNRRPKVNGGSGAQHDALSYLRAGFSVLPIRADGSKAPAVDAWKRYQTELPTEADVRNWYDNGAAGCGVAVVGGAVSGRLAIVDVEFFDVWGEYVALVDAEAPGLLERLPQVKTPGKDAAGGRHVYFRAPSPVSSAKLAKTTKADALQRTGDAGRQTLIEVKGGGGYCLAPGCPPRCHESGRLYEHVDGPPIVETPTLNAEEVEVLLRCARALHRDSPEPGPPKPRRSGAASGNGEGLRPGDDYDRRGDWNELLTRHGWKPCGPGRWTRPGKRCGVSATTGYCHGPHGEPLLHVFTTNASPFEDGRTYGLFNAFTLLEHAGDHSAAARALAKEGYGEPTRKPQTKTPAQSPRTDAGGLCPVHVGPLVVEPGRPRRTPSKLVLPVTIRRNGEALASSVLTTASSGTREVLRLLGMLSNGLPTEARSDAERALLKMLADAGVEADRPTVRPSGPTLLDILRERVPPAFALAYRTARGAWSELHGREVTRAEFLAYTPEDLLQAAACAVDVPRPDNGTLPLPELVRVVETGLRVLWASLVPSLPMQTDADLAGRSRAAQAFRSALEQIMKKPTTFEVERGSTPSAAVACRASLVSRVRRQVADNNHNAAASMWRKVHTAFSAWWRREITRPDGEEIILLAIRWELAGQVGVELPGVNCQTELTTLAQRYGLLQPNAGRLTDGGRLVVLSAEFSRELLNDAADLPVDADVGDAAENNKEAEPEASF
jgi:hypothetical protein